MEALIDLNKSSDYVNLQLKDKTWQIKIIGTPEDPYFCGKDVCEILKYDNIKKALQNNVRPKHKKMLSEFSGEVGERNGAFGHSHVQNLTYNEGKAIYINKFGLLCLLQKGNKMIHAIQAIITHPFIKKHCGDINIIVPTKEQNYISNIMVAFMHHKMKTQYVVGKYRVDLYFTEHKIAVECDEYGHRDRDPEAEKIRQKYIEDTLGCAFVRFNPDKYNFDIFVVINAIMQLI